MSEIVKQYGVMDCPHYDLIPKDYAGNVRFRMDLLKDAQNDVGMRNQLKKMCAEDLLFYVNAFCFTYDPRNEEDRVMPFISYEEFQDEAFLNMADAIITGRDISCPKSRCMGASWIGLTVFEWFWHFRDMMSFLLISRNEKYVDESGNPKSLFWKIDFLHQNQPRWLLPTGRHLGRKDPHRKLLHLGNADNGSVIDGESTTGDAGRGDRRSAMFVDEHAAFEINDGFKVLRATRDTTKCRIFNSTPQGANNAFYEVVHKSAARQIRMHWTQHPIYNRGLYTSSDGVLQIIDSGYAGEFELSVKGEEPIKGRYPEDYPFILDGKVRSPWYDNECARCVSDMEIAQELDIDFLGSDYQYFDATFIQKLIERYCRPEDTRGRFEYDTIDLTPDTVVENEKGELRLWMQLSRDGKVPTDRKFVVGADVSAGTGASNSVASVVDRETGEKVAVWIDSKTRPKQFAETCISLAKFFNNAFMIWDASGPTGKTFTMEVIDRGYGNIYYRRNEKKVSKRVTDEPGYYLQPEMRSSLLEQYRSALSNYMFINPSETGMKECLQFIVQPGGMIVHSGAANSQDPSGARTAHGDEVIADALANKGLNERGVSIMDRVKPEIPEGCLAARIKRREEAQLVGSSELDDSW